jgi:exonuclease SbcC
MMILSKLLLQNFKKYKEYSIEFSEGLIGIIGKNGSGKSTIFEAILFALYGELKSKKYKEVIRNSNVSQKDSVIVELDFEFENKEYKVRREFRGKALSAVAKFYKNDELITTGAKEVTQNIVKLTKLSKDAFLHTLFASQKELTSLSSLKNEDRKKMIRKLLGLEKIDFIEKELVEKIREIKRELETFKEILLSDEDIEQKEQKIKLYKEDIVLIQKDVEIRAKELDSLKLKELDIKKELDVFIKTKEKKQKLYSSLELIRNSIDSNVLQKEKISKEIVELELKQKEYETKKSIKDEYLNLEKSLKVQDSLKEISLKKEGLLKEQEQLRVQYSKTKEDIKLLEKECEPYEQHKFDLKSLEQSISLLQDNIIDKQTIEKELHSQILSEKKHIEHIDKKINDLHDLGKNSACPTCTRPLLEEYDKVIDSLKLTVEDNHKTKIKEFQVQLNHILEQKNSLEKDLNQKQKTQQDLIKSITLIQSKQKDLLKAKEYFSVIEQTGVKNKKELENLEQYSYDEKQHENLQNSFNDLKPKYQYVLNLEVQIKRIDILKKIIQQSLYKQKIYIKNMMMKR